MNSSAVGVSFVAGLGYLLALAFGIQDLDNVLNSKYGNPITQIFLDAVSGMGLRLAITEFDVGERGTPPDIVERDRQIADLAHRYLDFMFAYRNLDYMMAWGMVDHYSWLQEPDWDARRPDGMLKRPTLYDDNYQPKSLRQTIAAAFRNAPLRA